MDVQTGPHSVLTSLTHLMASWSSAKVQGEIAADAGVDIDLADIPAIYMLGLEGPLRASDLAARLHLSRPTASKLLARLERSDLISRSTDPDDGRVAIIALSPTGAAQYEQLVSRGRALVAAALSSLPATEAPGFVTNLAAFVAALGVAPADPATPEPEDARPLGEIRPATEGTPS